MVHDPLRRLIHSLHAAGQAAAAIGDAELLERFVACRDQAAFELLLWRHGPMVLGVCRRLLFDAHDAEDAFQATFLALVRRAGSVARGEALGGWLYQVAYRAALRARTRRARRERRERAGVEALPAPAPADPVAGDLRAVLDEELNRLPARQRTAFVLCCLEGKTGEEAARALGCPPGTVSSRLTRARARLCRRLARRGLAPSAALAALLAGEAAAVPPTAALVHATLNAVRLFAAGGSGCAALSPQIVSLAQGVLRTMMLNRLKNVALLLVFLGSLAAGGTLTYHALQAAPPDEQARTKPAEKKPAPVTVQVTRPQPGGLDRVADSVCTVQAAEQYDLFARVAGVLAKQAVDLGDHVKKGQLLAEIDAPLLVLDEKQAVLAVELAQAQIREAEARLVTDRAEAQASKSILEQRKAELESAQANEAFRQRMLARMKDLLKQNSIDERLVDEATARHLAARAQLIAARAALAAAEADRQVKQGRILQAEAAVLTAKAGVASARLGVEKARHALDLTRITAPSDGIVTQRGYNVGSYVRPGEARAQPLLTVQRIDLVRVIAHVAERDVPLTATGAPVALGFNALPGVSFTGYKVARIGFVEDPSTHSMRVEIDVPNPKDQLRPGMFGMVEIMLRKAAPGALHLPVAVLTAEGGANGAGSVYVVRDGTAQRTPIRVGTRWTDQVEILSGLKPTDRVVLNPSPQWGKVVPVQVNEKPDGR